MGATASNKQKNESTGENLGGKFWQFLLQRARFGGFSAYAPAAIQPSANAGGKVRNTGMQLALATHVSVNCVVFGFNPKELKVLLLESKTAKGNQVKNGAKISLPGDMVQKHENLDDSAMRISRGFTGLEHVFLEQLVAHGYPGNKKAPLTPQPKSPNNHTQTHIINIAYFAIINLDDYLPPPGPPRLQLKWYSLKEVPKLANNHNQVLEKALETLRIKLKYFPLAFELLPEKFTLAQVQGLYEAISGKKFDKRNFRKKLQMQSYLVQLKEKEKGVSHKPALYYTFNYKAYLKQRADISANSLF